MSYSGPSDIMHVGREPIRQSFASDPWFENANVPGSARASGLSANSGMFSHHYASGRLFASDVLDSFMCQTYLNPSSLILMHMMADFEAEGPRIFHKSLSVHAGLTYERLFVDLLCNEKKLCVGLYRTTGIDGSRWRYVVANPSKNSIIREDDIAFVIAARE